MICRFSVPLVEVCGYGTVSGVPDFDLKIQVCHVIRDYLSLQLFPIESTLKRFKTLLLEDVDGSFSITVAIAQLTWPLAMSLDFLVRFIAAASARLYVTRRMNM